MLVNCCDVVRRLYDILKNNRRLDFLYLLDLPHKSGEAERRRFAEQLRRLTGRYESFSGRPFSWEKAWEALPRRQEDGAGRTLRQPAGGPRRTPASGKGQRSPAGQSPGRYLQRPPAGCAGRTKRPGAGKQFFEQYAGLLAGAVSLHAHGAVKKRKAEDPSVRGIIYHTMKFCDYYSFEYASLRERCKVPLLKIETDGTRQSEGQLSTRITAFGESGPGALPGIGREDPGRRFCSGH